MSYNPANSVFFLVTGNPGVGSTIAVGAGVAGYQTPAQAGRADGTVCDVRLESVDANGNPIAPFEILKGSVYSAGAGTFSRSAGLVEDGTAGPGSLNNFSSGTQRAFVTVAGSRLKAVLDLPNVATEFFNGVGGWTAAVPPGVLWGPDHGVVLDGKHLTDANITNGQTALTTTTSTPFVAGDLNKRVLIPYGAGSNKCLSTYITAVVANNHVTVHDAASATVTNGECYYSTGCGAAIQALIGAIVSGGNPSTTSVHLRLPAGMGILDDQSLTTVNGDQFLLVLPQVDTTSRVLVTVMIEGAFPPPQDISQGGFNPQLQGTILLSGQTSTNGAAGMIGTKAASGNSTLDISYVHPVLLNLTLRVLGPDIGLCHAHFGFCSSYWVDKCNFDTGDYGSPNYVQPTQTSSTGFVSTYNNGGNSQGIGTIVIAGCYTGFDYSEHVVAEHIILLGCLVALRARGGYHANAFKRVQPVHCPYGIVAAGSRNGGNDPNTNRTCVVQWDNERLDDSSQPAWQRASTGADVTDASNYLVGDLTYTPVQANSGDVTTWNKTGGSNFQCRLIGAATGGGGTGDMLASLVNAPNALTNPSSGSNTLSASTLNVITATAGCSAKMPAPSAKVVVGIRITDASTNLFTLHPNGSETINFGRNTSLIMWAGETAYFESDGTNWFLLMGICHPMQCFMTLTGTPSSLAQNTLTAVGLDTTILDNTGLMANAGGYVLIQRAGSYTAAGSLSLTDASSTSQGGPFVYDGSTKLGSSLVEGLPFTEPTMPLPFTAALNDHIILQAYQNGLGGGATIRHDGSAATSLYVQEIPSW